MRSNKNVGQAALKLSKKIYVTKAFIIYMFSLNTLYCSSKSHIFGGKYLFFQVCILLLLKKW